MVLLLVALGAVGLRVLSGLNQQTKDLITLQRKIEAYRQLQHDTTSQLYGVTSALLFSDDRMLEDALRRLAQFGYDLDRLQFVSKSEVALMGQVREQYDRFAGDGVMVLFNDPLPCADPQLRAVRMALEMRDGVAALAVNWRKLGHDLGFGIGVGYGFATLGRVGFEGRMDYSAIGSVVNLAARLCGEAKDGQILVDGKVHAAVEGLPRSTQSATSI
jgi:class 3 adenylate cyclase